MSDIRGCGFVSSHFLLTSQLNPDKWQFSFFGFTQGSWKVTVEKKKALLVSSMLRQHPPWLLAVFKEVPEVQKRQFYLLQWAELDHNRDENCVLVIVGVVFRCMKTFVHHFYGYINMATLFKKIKTKYTQRTANFLIKLMLDVRHRSGQIDW